MHYLVLFRQNRDVQQISCLGRQMWGKGGGEYLSDAYTKSVARKYGYLVIDCHPHTNEDTYRLRSQILPSQLPMLIYQKKKT